MFERLVPPPVDSLMEIGHLHRTDPRPDKIDLGLGTYRDAEGEVAILEAVRAAEQRLAIAGIGKAYKGPAGDRRFADLVTDLHFPDLAALRDGRLVTMQAPGGTGALRLALELVARSSPGGKVLVGTPSWPAHMPMAVAVGLNPVTYAHVDPSSGQPDIAALLFALDELSPGDAVILHGCCHNPTGAAFSPAQWPVIAEALVKRQLLPVIDLAYAGMADGIEPDAEGARLLLDTLPEAMVAISCSKSFGLYRERAGLLVALTSHARDSDRLDRMAQSIARLLWSNPPDHGAAIVRTILDDHQLSVMWRRELAAMRGRLIEIRAALAESPIVGLDLSRLSEQQGLFAVLPLAPAAIAILRERHGIYIEGAGRINIAGLNARNFDRFATAIREVVGSGCEPTVQAGIAQT